jgi:hypothetical protein
VSRKVASKFGELETRQSRDMIAPPKGFALSTACAFFGRSFAGWLQSAMHSAKLTAAVHYHFLLVDCLGLEHGVIY